MSCKECNAIIDVDEAGGPYLLRSCNKCGRQMRIREPGKHGIGLAPRKGDQIVIPASFLKISANPLKSIARLTRYGLSDYSCRVFDNNAHRRPKEILDIIAELDGKYGSILDSSPLLEGFDLHAPDQAKDVFDKLSANKDTVEWWVYVAGAFLSIAKDAIEENDASKAAWAMTCGERFRSLCIFKKHFEEVVWMGHSAGRLIDLLELWEAHKGNTDESFWQYQFQQYSFALSQLFSAPITFIKDNAYVGGQQMDRKDSRLVDFIFSGGGASIRQLLSR